MNKQPINKIKILSAILILIFLIVPISARADISINTVDMSQVDNNLFMTHSMQHDNEVSISQADTDPPQFHGMWSNIEDNIVDVSLEELKLFVNMSDVYITSFNATFKYANGTDFAVMPNAGSSCTRDSGLEYCIGEGIIRFDPFRDEGTIFLAEVEIFDQNENLVHLYNGTDFNTAEFTFELTGRIIDTDPPVIRGTYFSYRGNTRNEVNIDVIEEAYYADQNYIYLYFDMRYGDAPPVNITVSYTLDGETFDPESTSGTFPVRAENQNLNFWIGSILITSNSFRGEGLVEISTVEIEDEAGNTVTYTGDEVNFASVLLIDSARKGGTFITQVQVPQNVDNGTEADIVITISSTFDIDIDGVNFSATIYDRFTSITSIEESDITFINQEYTNTLSIMFTTSGDYRAVISVTDDLGREWMTEVDITTSVAAPEIPEDPATPGNSTTPEASNTSPASLSITVILFSFLLFLPIRALIMRDKEIDKF